jgi:hypothetical protein
MSKKEIASTLRLAQELVNHLPKELKEMDDKLKRLILRAKAGEEPMIEIEIIDLLSSHEITRLWMKEQIGLQSGQKDTTRGYDTLAGTLSVVPTSQKWICPANSAHWKLVIQEDEDAPICEEHNIAMIRDRKKKG